MFLTGKAGKRSDKHTTPNYHSQTRPAAYVDSCGAVIASSNRDHYHNHDEIDMANDYPSHRLFRFPKPQWLNSANSRTAGVYLAGGLVSRRQQSDRREPDSAAEDGSNDQFV